VRQSSPDRDPEDPAQAVEMKPPWSTYRKILSRLHRHFDQEQRTKPPMEKNLLVCITTDQRTRMLCTDLELAFSLEVVLVSFLEVWSEGSIPSIKVTLIDPTNFPPKAAQAESVAGTRPDQTKTRTSGS
jgi:hypothetical protein